MRPVPPSRSLLAGALFTATIATMTLASPAPAAAQQQPVRFMTLDPGHFHAALIHKEMYPQVAPRTDIYAPLGFDLLEHLNRVSAFNNRGERPTSWEVEMHASPDFFQRMLRERPGNVVVISGRNRQKIDYILGSLTGGIHVLADKPWIVRAEDFSRLQQALRTAEEKSLVAYDIMTERYEITNMLQRELVNDAAVFGRQLAGTPEVPGVYMKSVHYILKTVAGAPLRRPAWFFDPREQGEALSDIGTHLVDLSLWTLSPREPVDYRGDVKLVAASRWPTVLSREQFAQVTGEREIPQSLAQWTRDGRLECECNTQVTYAVRGTHVKLDVLWDVQSAEHGDTHFAVYRGDRARVEVRQGAEEKWRPETYVVPSSPARRAEVLAAVKRRVQALQDRWPGVGVEERGAEILITIPDRYRVGHEAHFAEVAQQFLKYLEDPRLLPEWEEATMLAKYYITTQGTELSHRAASR